MSDTLSWSDRQAAVAAAAASFPSTFGLRTFPGKVFRVSLGNSYYCDGGVTLYTDIRNPDGSWADFAKGAPEELRGQIVRL